MMSPTVQLTVFVEVNEIHEKFLAVCAVETLRMPEATATGPFGIDAYRT